MQYQITGQARRDKLAARGCEYGSVQVRSIGGLLNRL
jgi:hypothetical protein